ncbi:MAG: hypothetical protein M1820_006537 [Bogoriella megaspora]|nr:MAG: hypothetical protein M1820_006537 [Bogoriella megaspora]
MGSLVATEKGLIYPGPKLWTASSIPYFRALLSGNFATTLNDIHNQYGSVVRVAPDELSYIDEGAWKTIYAYNKGGCFAKSPKWYQPRNNGEVGIMSASPKDHSRFRRAFAPAFADKRLAELEPLFIQIADQLVTKLATFAKSGEPADICEWVECATFDFAAEFGFSKSLECLEKEDNRQGINLVQGSVHTFAQVVPARVFNLLWLWKRAKANDPLTKNRAIFEKKMGAWMQDRLAEGEKSASGKEDLMTWIGRREGKGGELSKGEVANAFADFIVAGTEASASAVVATLYQLLHNPKTKEKLENELRSTFSTSYQITPLAVSGLPYLNACINETMRMVPTLPNTLPRIVPEQGAEICGRWVPGGTFVSFTQFAAYHSRRNFSDPESYKPERWIDPSTMERHNSDVFHPFSIGPRSCIGENIGWTQVRLFLAKMIWHFDFTRMVKDFEWEDQPAYLIYKKDPMLVELKKR